MIEPVVVGEPMVVAVSKAPRENKGAEPEWIHVALCMAQEREYQAVIRFVRQRRGWLSHEECYAGSWVGP